MFTRRKSTYSKSVTFIDLIFLNMFTVTFRSYSSVVEPSTNMSVTTRLLELRVQSSCIMTYVWTPCLQLRYLEYIVYRFTLQFLLETLWPFIEKRGQTTKFMDFSQRLRVQVKLRFPKHKYQNCIWICNFFLFFSFSLMSRIVLVVDPWDVIVLRSIKNKPILFHLRKVIRL